MQRRKTLLSWSSGKDSAWALHALRRDPAVELVGLLTTLNESFARVAMHAVRETLLERQAQAAGLPLWKIPLPYPCPNEAYERIMAGVIQRAQSEGVKAMAFGDLFLEDIRAYRERQLDGTGLEPLFPIWGIPTDELARTMVAAGLRAHITCVDPRQLDRSFAGRVFDADFLADLPTGVDPCGENGEFHSFATDGPMFSKRLEVQTGEVVERDGFVFADLL
jgi:uncharacterized protein (TIGR00290 family)